MRETVEREANGVSNSLARFSFQLAATFAFSIFVDESRPRTARRGRTSGGRSSPSVSDELRDCKEGKPVVGRLLSLANVLSVGDRGKRRAPI